MTAPTVQKFKPILPPRDPAAILAAAEKVDEFAAEQGVKTLVPKGEGGNVVTMPSTAPAPAETPPRKAPSKTAPKASAQAEPDTEEITGIGRLTMRIPNRVLDQLSKRAHKNRTTIRFVVMQALKNDNFDISEDELVKDGRREKR